MPTTETITHSVQPDIQYHPDYEKYQARTLRRKQNEVLQVTLPDGFPPQLDSPLGNPDKPYTLRPLLYHQPATATTPERVLIQYTRRYFTGFRAQPRTTDIPPITEAQAEALDALHFLAEQHSASLGFQKGDIQYVNNLSIFHARNGFKDGLGNERHLLRVWLRDPENVWETPKQLLPLWDMVFGNVTADKQAFPLEPAIRKNLGS